MVMKKTISLILCIFLFLGYITTSDVLGKYVNNSLQKTTEIELSHKKTTRLKSSKFDESYKEEEGYEEYVSDANTGYEDAPYYCTNESMAYYSSKSKKDVKLARKYYNNNKRRCGDYLITDYEDGVCINKCYATSVIRKKGYSTDFVISIPETIDGRPVVKLGGYIYKDEYGKEVVGAFAGYLNITLVIPSTVRVIGRYTAIDVFYLSSFSVGLLDINVDKDNPYYASKGRALYTKDFKCLLWEEGYFKEYGSNNIQGYIIPDYVEVFKPSNGVNCFVKTMVFGKNIKKIEADFDFQGDDPLMSYEEAAYYGSTAEVVVLGYSGTAAEEWAKNWRMTFIAINGIDVL